MEKNAEKVWTNCLKIINDIVERQHYKTWFEPIRPVSLKNNVLVIQVPSQFFFEYLYQVLRYFEQVVLAGHRNVGLALVKMLVFRAQCFVCVTLGSQFSHKKICPVRQNSFM